MIGRDKKNSAWKWQRVLVLSPTPTHPQNFGNRKRVNAICTSLKNSGADISFVHYPAENEWRESLPLIAERAMARTWSQYFIVGPSRQLHTAPQGLHHTIDEWWDEAIGSFLRWLFSVQSFDAFIVNYSWLSRAFDYAPASVVKILDTHDKVSGRRELLERHGISPEYFFVEDEQEAIALGRADLVWAIKDEERLHFEQNCSSPVMSLPHLDPQRPVATPEADGSGYLRVGFVGAANSINRVNFTNFVKIAEPIFLNAFAPVKLIAAGSVCDLLEELDSPFLELRGRVPDVEAFYRSVDCVAVPMTFSTGLKIKTGEAISMGLPVVATAHAFEGYAPADPLHSLPDLSAMAEAIADLSFAPRSRLEELAAASEVSYRATAEMISQTLDRSGALVRDCQHSIVIAVHSLACMHGSIFNVVLRSMLEYLRYLGTVTVLVVKGSAADVARDETALDQIGRVLVAEDLPDLPEHRARLVEMGIRTVGVASFLSEKRPKVLLADAMHAGFGKAVSIETVLFARAEMIALAEGRPDFHAPGASFRRVLVVAGRSSADVARCQTAAAASLVLAPCLYRLRISQGGSRVSASPHVILLGSPQSQGMRLAVALAKSWQISPHIISGLTADSELDGIAECRHSTALDYLAALMGGAKLPSFAIDLSGGMLGLQLVAELLERLDVPVVTTGSVELPRSLKAATVPVAAFTEFELFEVFRTFLLEPETRKHPGFALARSIRNSDRGWAYLWSFCKRIFESGDIEFT